MQKALYVGSFDPITNGHLDIVRRAKAQCEHLTIGLGINADKKYTFSLDERLAMVRRAVRDMPGVNIVTYNGLYVDYARINGFPVVIRGMRKDDAQFEKLLFDVAATQKLGIETVMLWAGKDTEHISSSAVKELQKNQGRLEAFVPFDVKQRIEERISGQYILAVTGSIGCGKSYVCKQFEALGKAKNIPVHNIDLDIIGHKILGDRKEGIYTQELFVQARASIARAFGAKILLPDGYIDRKMLGDVVFHEPTALAVLNEIIQEPLIIQTRAQEMVGKKGLVLLNAALIAETGISYMSNHNVVLVHADEATQMSRLSERGLSKEQTQRRVENQYNTEAKRAAIQEQIRRHSFGTIIELDNSASAPAENIHAAFRKVVDILRIPEST
jgi:pantetheine-phosphate adenylyltransferase